MALAVDSEMSGGTAFGVGSTSAITSPQTFSFTNTAGTVLYLFAGLGVNAGSTTSFGTVSYNGVSMTNVAEITTPSGASRAAVFRLLSPATGANTVSIGFTMSSSANYAVWGGCISFTGNHASTPEAQSTTANGSGTSTPSAALSGVTAGNITIAAAGGGTSMSAQTQTLSFSKNINNFSQLGNTRGSRATSSGSVTHSFTMGGNDSWTVCLVEVAAAAAASATSLIFADRRIARNSLIRR